MSVVALGVLSGSAAVHSVLGWVWPPALLALVVWMVWRARRQLRSRSRRWLLYPVLAVLVIPSIGGGFQTVSATLDAAAYPAPGQLVDIGGRKLHLHCTGSGSPTVVLEPGHGGSSSDLGWIAPTVARDSRVCVYDRAGGGWSDPPDGPQDAVHIAADLNTLLDRADVPGPYVLAGHSFGGLYTLTFAARYPDPRRRPGATGLHRAKTRSDAANWRGILRRPWSILGGGARGRSPWSHTPDRSGRWRSSATLGGRGTRQRLDRPPP